MNESEDIVRREVKARSTGWARRMAGALAKAGVTPNTVSISSVFFAAGCGACLVLSVDCGAAKSVALFILAAVLMQCRLLCNLFDGMIAVEGGRKTKSGEIFNDLPDRIADPVILVCAGYAAPHVRFGVELGWLAGLLAVMTAYVRVLAGASGASQRFLGPMAKQHRMAVMTLALVMAAIAVKWDWHERVIALALVLIVLGCAITVWRRARLAVRDLEAK